LRCDFFLAPLIPDLQVAGLPRQSARPRNAQVYRKMDLLIDRVYANALAYLRTEAISPRHVGLDPLNIVRAASVHCRISALLTRGSASSPAL
jgi:hypothetical protein